MVPVVLSVICEILGLSLWEEVMLTGGFYGEKTRARRGKKSGRD